MLGKTANTYSSYQPLKVYIYIYIDPANAIEELQDIDSTSDVSAGAEAFDRTVASDADRLSTIDEELEEYLAGTCAAGTPGGHESPAICPTWCDADM